jgi:hypothetical protein
MPAGNAGERGGTTRRNHVNQLGSAGNNNLTDPGR